MALKLVETRVDLGIIKLLGSFGYRLEHERLRVDLGIQRRECRARYGCRSIVSATHDHTVTDEEQKLALVVILEAGERVDGLFEVRLRLRYNMGPGK